MLLRSASTPVLGSLLSSYADSPNNSNLHHQSEFHGSAQKHTPSSIHGKLSCTDGGSQNFSKSMFHSPSIAEMKSSRNGFRRVQSEGNLEQLVDASYNVDEFSLTKRSARRTSCCNLESIPSFSLNHLGTRFEDDDSDCEEEFEDEKEEGIDAQLEFEDSSKSLRVENLILEQPKSNENDYGSLSSEGEGKMYLATGLGISGINFVGGGGCGGGGGGSYRPVAFDRDGGDSQGLRMEEHYKSILEQNPGNPLFLRNYAQFLYQKGELGTAEEYYSRAILADPEDGEVLSQYAKLLWELHHDKVRAATYFERAIRASSENSHIQAAYASFLWDTEDDEEDEENKAESSQIAQPPFHHGLMASATA